MFCSRKSLYSPVTEDFLFDSLSSVNSSKSSYFLFKKIGFCDPLPLTCQNYNNFLWKCVLIFLESYNNVIFCISCFLCKFTCSYCTVKWGVLEKKERKEENYLIYVHNIDLLYKILYIRSSVNKLLMYPLIIIV